MALLTQIKVWRLRGTFSPPWAVKVWQVVKWGLGLLPVGAIGKSAWDARTRGSASAWIAVAVGWLTRPWVCVSLVVIIFLLLYLFWASSDARGRLDLLSLCKPSKSTIKGFALTAAELAPQDLLLPLTRSEPVPDFLQRRVRPRIGSQENKPEYNGVQLICDTWKLGRSVAVLGPAGMGKTRLVGEAVKHLCPTTLVLVPTQKGVDDAQADRVRYLSGRQVVIIFDDSDYYTKQDLAGFVRLVTLQTNDRCDVAATCTAVSLATVTNDAVPQLRDYFSSMRQYDLLPMDDAQMDSLKGFLKKRNREPSELNFGGNPGLLLFDLDPLRTAYSSMLTERRDVLQTVALLFWANVRPITPDLLLIATNRLFQRTMDMPTLRGVIKVLHDLSFVKISDPVEPEEAFLDAVVNGRAQLLGRVGEVEQMLSERGDSRNLFLLGVGYYFRKAFDDTVRVMSYVADLYRRSGDLARAANALISRGEALQEAGQPLTELESAYRGAAEVGRQAKTQEGLAQTARALVNLGDAFRIANRPVEESESLYREAANAGLQAASPEGLMQAQRAYFNLGVALGSAKRPLSEVINAYRQAADVGRKTATPEALTLTTWALFNLAGTISNVDQPLSEVVSIYLEAAEAGRRSATSSGLVETAKALFNFAQALRAAHQPLEEVERGFLGAAGAWREVGVPEAQVEMARALLGVGVAYQEAGQPVGKVASAYRRAADAGRESGSPGGLALAADALFRLGNVLLFNGQSRSEITRAYLEAAGAARQAGTPEALENGASALKNLAKYLATFSEHPLRRFRTSTFIVDFFIVLFLIGREAIQRKTLRRRLPNVEKTSRDAAQLGQDAGTPTGFAIAAGAMLNLGFSLDKAGRQASESRPFYQQALELGLRAATPEGRDVAWKASENLKMDLSL